MFHLLENIEIILSFIIFILLILSSVFSLFIWRVLIVYKDPIYLDFFKKGKNLELLLINLLKLDFFIFLIIPLFTYFFFEDLNLIK